MSEYSAEELLRLSQFVKDMQSILGGSRDDNDDDEARAWDDYEKASSALTAYAERIKADEGANDRIDFKGMWNAMSDRAYAHPPAQAAQVDPAAKPRTIADFVNAPDAERARTGQQVAARVDELMAEPVAQATQVDWIAALRKELLHSKMTHNFTFTRDEVMQLIGDPFSQPRAVPDGMVLVPEIATQAMVDAGSKEWRHQNIFGIWEAMLAAAPSPGESA